MDDAKLKELEEAIDHEIKNSTKEELESSFEANTMNWHIAVDQLVEEREKVKELETERDTYRTELESQQTCALHGTTNTYVCPSCYIEELQVIANKARSWFEALGDGDEDGANRAEFELRNAVEYEELIRKHRPHPINNDSEYKKALKKIDRLMRSTPTPSEALTALISKHAEMVERYEEEEIKKTQDG